MPQPIHRLRRLPRLCCLPVKILTLRRASFREIIEEARAERPDKDRLARLLKKLERLKVSA